METGEYCVKFTDYAAGQLSEVVDYISINLMSPETAVDWIYNIQKKLETLTYTPERIKLTEEEPWRSRKVHRLTVGNFYAYFIIDEEAHEVWIIAFIYARRDQKRQLKQMDDSL